MFSSITTVRRNIAYLFKIIWDNSNHREALKKETRTNMDKFVRFVNLMINDVTYLMDESLSDLAKIHEIQQEMTDVETWNAQPQQYRRERESALRTLERHTSGYVQLGRSTVQMLKAFTGETKEPFMVPEIVDRLAAMLDYNLDALAGPKCQNLLVKNPEKYKFEPKALLSDIIDVYLNLSDQGEFVRAVAADGRSYRKELFERAAGIAKKRLIKSETEVEKLLMFVVKVEEKKATLEAEEDLGDVPEEFLGELATSMLHLAIPDRLWPRPVNVHRDARSRHAAILTGGCGPIDHQVALAFGRKGPLQPCAFETGGSY